MNLAISLKTGEHLVYIAFGGNLGDVETTIKSALELLERELGELLKKSKIYQTSPLTAPGINPSSVPNFFNGAAVFKTKLHPGQVLSACLRIEQVLGRTRDVNNQLASRTIDLDIALYDDLVIEQDNLIIPHPRLHLRDFVLVPLLDLESNLEHPVMKTPLSKLLESLQNKYVI